MASNGNYKKDEGQNAAHVKYGFIDLYHAKRRRAILNAHPEVRECMIVDPSFKYVAVACATTQLLIAYLLRDEPLGYVLFMGAVVGTIFDCAITNSVHELIHEMAIENWPLANKILSGYVNLALFLPFAAGYHRSHRHHHSFLGTDLDAKYPTMEEALQYDQNIIGRLKYIFTHPLQGGSRWNKIVPGDPPNEYMKWNERTVYLVDALILIFWGYKSLLYLLVAFWINDTIFIQGSKNFVDHWVSENETYTSSYYGWVNMIDFNIGYHREHHDFPNVPGRYLALITKMAPEFYEDKRYIAENLFAGVWNVLTAKPGKGLTKHANKLTLKQVEVKD